MSMTKPLSPAAQAVLDAYGDFEPANVDAMAAALVAAVDQVVPEQLPMLDHAYSRQNRIRSELLAIAAELEAQ